MSGYLNLIYYSIQKTIKFDEIFAEMFFPPFFSFSIAKHLQKTTQQHHNTTTIKPLKKKQENHEEKEIRLKEG
jgi:hypothetical protein